MINNKNFLIFLTKIAEAYPIGRVKHAPGTFASLAALVLGYCILIFINIKFYLLFVFIFVISSYVLCEIHIKVFNKKDPKEIVVDEFAGQFIALLGIINSNNIYYTLISLLLSFLLFRFFDITKIGLVGMAEKLGGGIGIMADDIVAGGLAGMCLLALQFGVYAL